MLKTRVPHRFSVDDYDRMIVTGILNENDRVELIRGEILEKMPIGDAHSGVVNRLTRLLVRRTGDDAVVSIQNPLQLVDSEPEPDTMVLRPRADFYESGKPRAEDVLLLIEVADSSLEFDREVKLPIYAEAGIREFWIVNLSESHVEVYRGPQSNGAYRDRRDVRPGEQIELLGLPGATIDVAEILA